MFWDRVADVYDIFVNVINRRTHQSLNIWQKEYSHLLSVNERGGSISLSQNML